MENGAHAAYNNCEREKLHVGICKAKWPSFSPDFNPIVYLELNDSRDRWTGGACKNGTGNEGNMG